MNNDNLSFVLGVQIVCKQTNLPCALPVFFGENCCHERGDHASDISAPSRRWPRGYVPVNRGLRVQVERETVNFLDDILYTDAIDNNACQLAVAPNTTNGI